MFGNKRDDFWNFKIKNLKITCTSDEINLGQSDFFSWKNK